MDDETLTDRLRKTYIVQYALDGARAIGVKAGERLLQLADLSTVWLEGEIYESDLPWIKTGMNVKIRLSEQPERPYSATVTFIDPLLNPKTRSVGTPSNAALAHRSPALRASESAHRRRQQSIFKQSLDGS